IAVFFVGAVEVFRIGFASDAFKVRAAVVNLSAVSRPDGERTPTGDIKLIKIAITIGIANGGDDFQAQNGFFSQQLGQTSDTFIYSVFAEFAFFAVPIIITGVAFVSDDEVKLIASGIGSDAIWLIHAKDRPIGEANRAVVLAGVQFITGQAVILKAKRN